MYSFSIIVPIYNVERYLNECIVSILQQTYNNLEVILVDDGSPDRCPQICDYYASIDSRVRVIHQNNGGLVSARIAGARVATGDYVCCVDGDDYIDNTYIERIDKVLSEYPVDVIWFNYHLVDKNEDTYIHQNMRQGYYDKENIISEIIPRLVSNSSGNYLTPSIWTKTYKRELYVNAQLKVNTDINIGEDAACSMQCIFYCDSLYVMEEALYYYRINKASMTKTRKPMEWKSAQCLSELLCEEFSNKGSNVEMQVNRYICHHFFNVAISQFNSRRKYRDIVKEIEEQKAKTIFREAIYKARFKPFSKAWFSRICIERRLFLLMLLFNYYRRTE